MMMETMAIKGCKTIAEYAFRRWMADQGFTEKCFSLEVTGNYAVIKDKNGDTLMLSYDGKEKRVYVNE